MPYTVSTPRRFDFETRLFGLALKQWGYLGVGVAIAGLIGLGVLIPGLPLGVRIALALNERLSESANHGSLIR